jgi:hypothetical protein
MMNERNADLDNRGSFRRQYASAQCAIVGRFLVVKSLATCIHLLILTVWFWTAFWLIG